MSYSKHPLVTNQAQFVTHQMIRVLRLCLDRVSSRRTAILFDGMPRVGKSFCSEFVKEQLQLKLPEVFVIYHIARGREPGKRPSVFSELCESEKIKPTERGVDYLHHLIGYIETHIAGRQAPQCVLVIDEIQSWRRTDYLALCDLFNYLQHDGVRLTVVGFGQSEIRDRRNAFLALNEDKPILARFFSEIETFYGCRTVEELSAIMSACDEGSEYPAGSGISYTGHFLPEALAGGFRLVQLTDLFWTALEESVKEGYDRNLPMQHLLESVGNFLLLAAPHDSATFRADERMVREAVYRSGLALFCDVRLPAQH